MPVYIEKKDKLKLKVSNTDKQIKIKVECYNGTIVTVKFFDNIFKNVYCGETRVIGTAAELKGKTLIFTGIAKNPNGEIVKIKHTIFEVGGNKVTYTFPDGYTGEPDFNSADPLPDYHFFLKLE